MNKIVGINAVREAIATGRVTKLYLQYGFSNKILDMAKKNNIETVFIEKNEFIKKFGLNSQGCVGEIKPFKTFSIEEIINSKSENDNDILVILDELNDPHNLGAILRSCDVFGVSGVIYKKNNQVQLNSTVAKVSAGAINYVKCCQVVNLTKTIEFLKKNGYWIIGLDGEAKGDLKSIPDYKKMCIIVGSEGYGISRLVRENCDLLAKIPMKGHVSCLNASVSCAIALYQIVNK